PGWVECIHGLAGARGARAAPGTGESPLRMGLRAPVSPARVGCEPRPGPWTRDRRVEPPIDARRPAARRGLPSSYDVHGEARPVRGLVPPVVLSRVRRVPGRAGNGGRRGTPDRPDGPRVGRPAGDVRGGTTEPRRTH